MVRLLALFLLVAAPAAVAQADGDTFAADRTVPDDLYDVEAAPAFYVIGPGATVRQRPEAGAPAVVTLRTRAGVRVLDTVGDWKLVQADDVRGYVPASALSNIWIRVDKSERTTFVYRGAELLRTLPADVSVSPEDKVRRSRREELDQYRIPEGTFYVTRRNPNSSYYRAFVLSYPGPVHAARGLSDGIITPAQYQTILRADAEGREPPMGTPLGGLIEIHGHGSGRGRAWTRGCVALRDVHMDELWAYVEIGTPVVIEP
ncbi:L,D-transpeptidase family protein [Rubrivirga sp. IMCC43871]|uniref:L,D-transpeptidase family protein n=1 Tax=Rubrivirga sp. IMCC43871 TaxID=3391575 RepID=UPI00399022E9